MGDVARSASVSAPPPLVDLPDHTKNESRSLDGDTYGVLPHHTTPPYLTYGLDGGGAGRTWKIIYLLENHG